MNRKACVVVNPRSAGGATGRRLDILASLVEQVLPGSDILCTERAGHATSLVRRALGEDSHDVVVSVGGDGTANECVNGFFVEGEPVATQMGLAVIKAGTGCDLVRTLEMPAELRHAVQWVRDRPFVPTDVLRCHYRDHEGRAGCRMGLNMVGFGLEGESVAIANRSSKRFGGKMTFFVSTMRARLRYREPEVHISWTDTREQHNTWQGPLLNAFVANARYAGGGMLLGERADMTDGFADLTCIPKVSLRTTARVIPALYRGGLHGIDGVQAARLTSLEARAVGDTPVLFDIDGEQPGTLPVRIEVLPRAIKLIGRHAGD